MTPGEAVTRGECSVSALVDQLHKLGVAAGSTVLAHTSFRAVRPVENGPEGLITALRRAIGPDGTLVMPSWPDDATSYDPAVTPAARDLGIVADTFWRLPGVRRTGHVQAFAAAGPQAARILSDPLPLPPHRPESPVGRIHELDGYVLLLGVHHDANTTIHLAELFAGVPYGIRKTCTTVVDGRQTIVEYRENDHCCARFRLVDAWLREAGVQREDVVGHATARLVSARDIVSVVVPRLERDPLTFLHDPDARCAECDEARASIGSWAPVAYRRP